MKYLPLILLAFISQPALGIHVSSKRAGVDFDTDKIAKVFGYIDYIAADRYEFDVNRTQFIPGPRIVLINSPGGSVEAGNVMIDIMEQERAMGVRQVCIVLDHASSMAFNLLTHCDIRLSVANAHMTVHKVEGWDGQRHTAANMRKVLIDLERIDEPFRQANSRAMHLTLRQYDRYADQETEWSPAKLLKMHYLDDIVNTE